MAEASKTTREREIKTTVHEDVVVLTLTPREAQTLADITNHVGGRPDGPRGDIDNIRIALRGAGVSSRHTDEAGCTVLRSATSAGIMMKETHSL